MFTASDAEQRRLGLRPQALQQIVDTLRGWYLQGDAGMQFALVKDGELILSVWEGYDLFTGQAIRRNTLFPLLSATKGLASIVVLHLHHLACFAWDDPLVRYWPEFGKHGKQRATIKDLLAHRLGLPSLTADWTHWTDRQYMTRLVEEAQLEWEPGTCYGYHGGSWGVILDELVRRWTGRETGQILNDEITSKLGVTDCYIGLPAERYDDVARLAFLEEEQRGSGEPLGPLGADGHYNSKQVLMSCQSSGGGVASAEDLARTYDLVVSEGSTAGTVFWSADAQRFATCPRTDPEHSRPAARPELAFVWGLGFMVSPSELVFGTVPLGRRTAGHPGASGAIGYADPDARVSVAFTINGVGGRRMYSRYQTLGDLVRSALDPQA